MTTDAQTCKSGPLSLIIRPYRLYREWKKKRGRLKRDFKRFQQRKQFYSAFVKPGDVCFDVGANLGTRSEVFLDLGASVLAVEPQECCACVLKEKFGTHPRFTLIEKALDKQEGQTEFYLSNAHTLSSMSTEWINRVQEENIFQDAHWDSKVVVNTTTLDVLVRKHGTPAFCKIDVEGAEINVLSGLSKPIGVISFEFAWQLDHFALRCIEHLENVGYHHFNYSIGETMTFCRTDWISAAELKSVIAERKKAGDTTGGDIYARC